MCPIWRQYANMTHFGNNSIIPDALTVSFAVGGGNFISNSRRVFMSPLDWQ